jgi:hypothetical protein
MDALPAMTTPPMPTTAPEPPVDHRIQLDVTIDGEPALRLRFDEIEGGIRPAELTQSGFQLEQLPTLSDAELFVAIRRSENPLVNHRIDAALLALRGILAPGT